LGAPENGAEKGDLKMSYMNSITLIGFVGADPEQQEAKGNGSKFVVLTRLPSMSTCAPFLIFAATKSAGEAETNDAVAIPFLDTTPSSSFFQRTLCCDRQNDELRAVAFRFLLFRVGANKADEGNRVHVRHFQISFSAPFFWSTQKRGRLLPKRAAAFWEGNQGSKGGTRKPRSCGRRNSPEAVPRETSGRKKKRLRTRSERRDAEHQSNKNEKRSKVLSGERSVKATMFG